MKKLGLFVLSLLFLFPSNSNSQIFGRIMDRAADDFSRKVEDKVSLLDNYSCKYQLL